MAPFSLFKRSRPEVEAVQKKPSAVGVAEPPAPPAPKRPIITLGLDSNGRWRGIFRDERIHAAVVGFPGTGKSRFLLSLAIQDVWSGYGVLLIDPHGDLAKIFLSHIPKERWKDVVYIDPLTARKYGRLVKINFLECKDVKDRDIVARCFMESLEKIYARYWGPRLDMILMNAIYTLLDAGNTNLSNLYSVIADEQFRDALLQKVGDDKIRSFWENEFKKMAKDASSAALTKIYRIVQERIVAPMFDCVESSIDFRRAMDEGKIVVVNLSEGAITSDVANFLGSLILARVYLAGMSREDTPEDRRRPFYVYVDEAYRFVSLSIRDILQSLRKYRVYMTLASQYLGQYNKEIAASIPHLCDTIVCFTVGEDTARALEEFFRPSLTYTDLVHLPRYTMAVSTIIGGSRECQVLRSCDLGWGENDVEELIKFSLERYGEGVDFSRYAGAPAVGELPHPTQEGFFNPLYWIVLTKLYLLYRRNIGAGMASQGSIPSIEHDDLVEQLKSECEVQEASILETLNGLAMRNCIVSETKEYDYEVVAVSYDPPAEPFPVTCDVCEKPTCRPFRLRNGKTLCKHCFERGLRMNDVRPLDVAWPVEFDPKTVDYRNVKRLRSRKRFYSITHIGLKYFLEGRVPLGARGGGVDHASTIGAIMRVLLRRYFYIAVDVGEEAPKKTEDGKEEYVVKRLPDMVVWPIARGKSGKLNPNYWDSAHAFTVEVEIEPVKHRQRVISNLRKADGWGRPVIFASPKLEWAIELYDIIKGDMGREVVEDNTGFFGGAYNPRAVSILYIDPQTETMMFITPRVIDSYRRGELAQILRSEQLPETAPAAETKLEAHEEASPIQPGKSEEAPSELAELTAEKEGVELRGEVSRESKDAPKIWEQLVSALAKDGWAFYMRASGGSDVIYAEKKVMDETLRIEMGPFERIKEALQKFNISLSVIEEREPVAPAPSILEGGAGPEHVEEKAAEPKEALEAAEAVVEYIKNASSPAEKMRVAAEHGFSFKVKRRGDKVYIYAQRRRKQAKQPDTVYIGTWDEELKRVAEWLKLKIPGLSEELAESENNAVEQSCR